MLNCNKMKGKHKKWLLGLDKMLAHDFKKQLVVLGFFMLFLLAMSYLMLSLSGCQWKAYCENYNMSWWLLPIYLLIDANALNNLSFSQDFDVHGWMLIVSIVTFLFGMLIFNGLIIGVINNAIDRRVNDYQDGYTHYHMKKHYVIMGYDDMVPSIINEIFLKNPLAQVLVLTAVNARLIKERLKKSVAKSQLENIIVNYGQRTAKEYYKDIHLESAVEIYIVGKRTLPYHDAVNVECVESVCSYLEEACHKTKPDRITCVFEDLDTYAAFKTSEIFDKVKALDIDFVPYNFYSGWAQQVFLAQTYKEKTNPLEELHYPTMYGNGIGPDDPRHVHLVFVGITKFSAAFAMEAANILHFPNFKKGNELRTRITFIDINADKEMVLFKTRNRHLFEVQDCLFQDLSDDKTPYDPTKSVLSSMTSTHNFLDVEFEFVKGNAYAVNIQEMLREWSCDDKQYLTIFVAMADQLNNFVVGMNLPDEVYDNAVPVFIRQPRADSFVTKLRSVDNQSYEYNTVIDNKLTTEHRKGRYANIYPFGMDDMAYFSDERSVKLAKLVNYLYTTADYENYKFKDQLALDAIPEDTILTDADNYWKDLTVALKWSNLYCVYNIICKLASLRAMRGLSPDDQSHDMFDVSEKECEVLGPVEHNRWNVEKLLMGYRKPHQEEDKYANPQFKDNLKNNKKLYIHHDIRPFEDLDDVRKLDYEIVRYMPWLLRFVNK